jgi:Immunity protein 63
MGNTIDLAQVEVELNRLADLIDAPTRIRPRFQANPDFDYIITRDQKYVLVNVDVFTTSEFVTTSLEDFWYHVFAGITHEMAELATARDFKANNEVRRVIWPKQLELMQHISPAWKKRLLQEFLNILEKNPVRDGLGDLAQKLRA